MLTRMPQCAPPVSTQGWSTPELFPAGANDAEKAGLAFAIGRFWKDRGDGAAQAAWQAIGNRFWLRARGFDPDASEAAGRLVKLARCAGCGVPLEPGRPDARVKGLDYHPACAAEALFAGNVQGAAEAAAHV